MENFSFSVSPLDVVVFMQAKSAETLRRHGLSLLRGRAVLVTRTRAGPLEPPPTSPPVPRWKLIRPQKKTVITSEPQSEWERGKKVVEGKKLWGRRASHCSEIKMLFSFWKHLYLFGKPNKVVLVWCLKVTLPFYRNSFAKTRTVHWGCQSLFLQPFQEQEWFLVRVVSILKTSKTAFFCLSVPFFYCVCV